MLYDGKVVHGNSRRKSWNLKTSKEYKHCLKICITKLSLQPFHNFKLYRASFSFWLCSTPLLLILHGFIA